MTVEQCMWFSFSNIWDANTLRNMDRVICIQQCATITTQAAKDNCKTSTLTHYLSSGLMSIFSIPFYFDWHRWSMYFFAQCSSFIFLYVPSERSNTMNIFLFPSFRSTRNTKSNCIAWPPWFTTYHAFPLFLQPSLQLKTCFFFASFPVVPLGLSDYKNGAEFVSVPKRAS